MRKDVKSQVFNSILEKISNKFLLNFGFVQNLDFVPDLCVKLMREYERVFNRPKMVYVFVVASLFV